MPAIGIIGGISTGRTSFYEYRREGEGLPKTDQNTDSTELHTGRVELVHLRIRQTRFDRHLVSIKNSGKKPPDRCGRTRYTSAHVDLIA